MLPGGSSVVCKLSILGVRGDVVALFSLDNVRALLLDDALNSWWMTTPLHYRPRAAPE